MCYSVWICFHTYGGSIEAYKVIIYKIHESEEETMANDNHPRPCDNEKLSYAMANLLIKTLPTNVNTSLLN